MGYVLRTEKNGLEPWFGFRIPQADKSHAFLCKTEKPSSCSFQKKTQFSAQKLGSKYFPN